MEKRSFWNNVIMASVLGLALLFGLFIIVFDSYYTPQFWVALKSSFVYFSLSKGFYQVVVLLVTIFVLGFFCGYWLYHIIRTRIFNLGPLFVLFGYLTLYYANAYYNIALKGDIFFISIIIIIIVSIVNTIISFIMYLKMLDYVNENSSAVEEE